MIRKTLIAFCTVLSLLTVVSIAFGVTASYNKTVQVVNSVGTVINGVASAVSASPQLTVRIVDSTGKVIDSFGTFSGGVLTPASGGVGAMTGAPMWARFFGTGVDSTGPASGTISNAWEKDYTSWTCTGGVTLNGSSVPIIRSQGTVALNTGCAITAVNNAGTVGDLGGGGGSGGSEGATNSVAGLNSSYYNNTGSAATSSSNQISPGGVASSSSAGNDATAITSTIQNLMFSFGPEVPTRGASSGSAGANTGGAGGRGGASIIIIAPTITIASGVTFNTNGGAGGDGAALLHGAGGGGGGGVIWLLSETFTDSGGIYNFGGGPGGNCTGPSVSAVNGGCSTAGGCGKDAVLTVTGVTTGGLDAMKITITSGGSGYQVAPACQVNVNGSGLTGSPACHFTISGGAIASVVIDTAGSGATFTSYAASCQIGGYGAAGFYEQQLLM